MDPNPNRKRNTLLIGALVGALVGVAAANALMEETEEGDGENALTPAKGVKMGMMVMNLLRQITNL